MGWKYVVMETRSPEGTTYRWPIIFPDKMIHADVFQLLRRAAPMAPGAGPADAVSAGKIEHLEVIGIGGDSETLRLKSKGDDDANLIENYSYFHGIV